jgi:hypothetical protein
MPLLNIDLQSGFADDTVVVRVNDEEVFHKQGVRTDYSIGRADSAEVVVPADAIKVEVILPDKHLSETIELAGAEPIYLGVSLMHGKLTHRISGEQFLYF